MRLAAIILVLGLAGATSAQEPDTIEQAIAQVKRITDPDPAAQDRKRAEEAMRIVQNRMKVINDVSGTFLQTIPIDVWNQVYGDGTILDRARVLDVARAKGWPLSKVAWFVKAGACDEHASVMQEILQGAGVRNVRIFRSNSPHAFPVVGLAPDADPDIPWTWGPNAFVPDTWVGKLLTATQTWDARHFFEGGDRNVNDGRLETRLKLKEMADRGRDFIEQHRGEYKRLLDRFNQIPPEIRAKLAFQPPPLTPLAPGAVLVQVQDRDKKILLARVTVLVTFPGKTEGLRTGTTDGNGKVLFANLPGGAGRYEVHALKQGYDKTTQAFELLFEQSAELFLDLRPAAKPDLAISMEWNTRTDVDLWVIEPDGTKCFYSHARTKNGGVLHQDITAGFGPEHFTAEKALTGEYTIQVHYYSGPRHKEPATQVRVKVTRFLGTPQETTQYYNVTVANRNDLVTVCRLRFEARK